MPLPEPMFCAQQIPIPPELPELLKQFTKAAIRTQPRDVLQWSAAYFRSLSRGEPLPVKERLEMPVATQKTDTGLSPGLLRVLHRQLAAGGIVPVQELERRWQDLCLPQAQLLSLLELGHLGTEVEWMKFLALACSALGGSITTALRHACAILTEDPEGGAARIPFQTFTFLYKYLALIDGDISDSTIEEALRALQEEADRQAGMIQPRNFLSPQCPRCPREVLNPEDLETASHENITEETEIQDEEFKERATAKSTEACLPGEDLTDNGLPSNTEGNSPEECPTSDETSTLDTGSLEETTVHVSAEALPLLRQGPHLVVELQDVAFQQQADGQRSISGEHSEGSVETDQSAQKSTEKGGESSSEEVETEAPVADRRGGLRRKARGYKGPPKRRAKLSA